MTTFLSTCVFSAAPVSDLALSGSSSQSSTPIEKKLQQLTRLLDARNKAQVRMQTQLDEISQEMNQMKGSIELFNHKLEQVETRQRNLYQSIGSNKPSDTKTEEDTTGGADKIAYQKAVNLVLVNKEFTQAITAFEAFIIDNPESSYVANSHYWLGQLLYKQKKRKEARNAFLTVSEKFPESTKHPDALFKIGIIDEYLGDIDSAKTFYNKVLTEFPDSSAAGLSKKRLANF